MKRDDKTSNKNILINFPFSGHPHNNLAPLSTKMDAAKADPGSRKWKSGDLHATGRLYRVRNCDTKF